MPIWPYVHCHFVIRSYVWLFSWIFHRLPRLRTSALLGASAAFLSSRTQILVLGFIALDLCNHFVWLLHYILGIFLKICFIFCFLPAVVLFNSYLSANLKSDGNWKKSTLYLAKKSPDVQLAAALVKWSKLLLTWNTLKSQEGRRRRGSLTTKM